MLGQAQRGWLRTQPQRCDSGTAFEPPPAAADGCCLPLLVQGGERRHSYPWGCRPAAGAALLRIDLVVVLVLVLGRKPVTATKTDLPSIVFLLIRSELLVL